MSYARKLQLTALALGALALATGTATWSAFSDQNQNGANTFASGTVKLEENDDGATMLSLSNATPGQSVQRCIELDYEGSLNASLRHFASVSGALGPYLTLTVTRGTESKPDFADRCSTFTADSTGYGNNAPGVIYRGALSAYPATYATGIVDPIADTPETWSTNEKHSYRYMVSVNNDYGAQGLSATATFTWEARNL